MKFRFVILLVTLPLIIAQMIAQMAQAADGREKGAATESVTRLPFDGAAPLPGALAISADGSTAVHIGSNGDVVLWDAVKVKSLETIPADGKKPSAVSLSPDGDLVAIGYFDSRVIVRSRHEHKLLREFKGHTGGVSALAFSLDGQMLASGGDDATTQLWEVSTGRRLRIFDSQFGGSEGGLVVSVGFSGNGRALIVNEWYSRQYDVGRGITLWDIEEGIEISTRDAAPPNGDNAMRAGQAVGGRGWLMAYTGDKGLMVERLDLCKPARQLPSGGYAETVAADPQGRWVAASEMKQLTFFGMSGNKKSYSIMLPAQAIVLAAHPDGRSVFALMITETQLNGNEHFIVGRDAETVTGSALYRIAVPAPLWLLPPVVVKEDAAHCAPSEAVRATQSFRLPEKPEELTVTARLVPTKDMTTNPENRSGEHNQINPPRDLYFAQDGSLYALYHAGSDSRSGVAVWNLQTKRPIRARFEQYIGDNIIRLREGWGADAETLTNLLTGKPFSFISNDGNKVTSDPDTGEIYRLMTGHFERYGALGKRLKDVPLSGTVVAFSARNGRLAALYSDGKIQVWPLYAGGKLKTSKLPPCPKEDGGCTIAGLELSADGNYVKISFDHIDSATDYEIFRLSSAKVVGEGMLLTPFLRHSNLGVVQDARPHHLAVWDFDRGEIIARLPRHRSRDTDGSYHPLLAAFSADGRWLASASYDGLVRVWNLKTRQVVGEGHLGGVVTAMSFDSSGRQLAAGRADGQLLVFQVPEPK